MQTLLSLIHFDSRAPRVTRQLFPCPVELSAHAKCLFVKSDCRVFGFEPAQVMFNGERVWCPSSASASAFIALVEAKPLFPRHRLRKVCKRISQSQKYVPTSKGSVPGFIIGALLSV